MGTIAIAALVFACLFGAAVGAMLARDRLPSHHLDERSKDAVKVAMGLIATMSALVLGLLVASAKTSYDAQSNQVRQAAANVGQLDHVLADYGPDAAEIRNLLRVTVARLTDQVWRAGASRIAVLGDKPTEASAWTVHTKIHELTPGDELHRELRTLALQITLDMQRARWQLLAAEGSSIPIPFLLILIFWLTVLFASFGLFAPWNTTVLTALLVGTLSVAGAIFLVLELDRPFGGLMQISADPVRMALDRAAAR